MNIEKIARRIAATNGGNIKFNFNDYFENTLKITATGDFDNPAFITNGELKNEEFATTDDVFGGEIEWFPEEGTLLTKIDVQPIFTQAIEVIKSEIFGKYYKNNDLSFAEKGGYDFIDAVEKGLDFFINIHKGSYQQIDKTKPLTSGTQFNLEFEFQISSDYPPYAYFKSTVPVTLTATGEQWYKDTFEYTPVDEDDLWDHLEICMDKYNKKN